MGQPPDSSRRVPFCRNNTVGRQFQDIKPSITNETEVGRRGDGEPVIEERRVLDRTAVIAFGTEVEHGSGGSRRSGEVSIARKRERRTGKEGK